MADRVHASGAVSSASMNANQLDAIFDSNLVGTRATARLRLGLRLGLRLRLRLGLGLGLRLTWAEAGAEAEAGAGAGAGVRRSSTQTLPGTAVA